MAITRNTQVAKILTQNTVFTGTITVGNDSINVYTNSSIIKVGSSEVNATSVKTDTVLVGSVAVYSGSGDPSFSAAQGSLYLNSAGSNTSNRAFINSNGSTGWTAFITAS